MKMRILLLVLVITFTSTFNVVLAEEDFESKSVAQFVPEESQKPVGEEKIDGKIIGLKIFNSESSKGDDPGIGSAMIIDVLYDASGLAQSATKNYDEYQLAKHFSLRLFSAIPGVGNVCITVKGIYEDLQAIILI